MPAENPCPKCSGLNYQGVAKCAHCGTALNWTGPAAVANAARTAQAATVNAAHVYVVRVRMTWGDMAMLMFQFAILAIPISILMALIYVVVIGGTLAGIGGAAGM